jgi:hypothetical protein
MRASALTLAIAALLALAAPAQANKYMWKYEAVAEKVLHTTAPPDTEYHFPVGPTQLDNVCLWHPGEAEAWKAVACGGTTLTENGQQRRLMAFDWEHWLEFDKEERCLVYAHEAAHAWLGLEHEDPAFVRAENRAAFACFKRFSPWRHVKPDPAPQSRRK